MKKNNYVPEIKTTIEEEIVIEKLIREVLEKILVIGEV